MNSYKSYNFYPGYLHLSLVSGSLFKGDDRINITSDIISNNIYLVTFRAYKTNKGIELVYNYMYYPYVFTDSVLGYLLIKGDFRHSYLFKEWGDFFTIIDESLFINDFTNNLKEGGHNTNEHFSEWYNTYGNTMSGDNTYLWIFDIIKKLVMVKNLDSLVTSLDLIVNKDYFKLICGLFPGMDKSESLSKASVPTDYYLLKDSLFVVKDLNLLLNTINKNSTYTVSKGNKNLRSQPNSMNAFLICLDEDYRNNLYKYHLNFISHGYIPNHTELSRSKFSFRNVHMNIGSVRYYSTSIKNSTNIKHYSTSMIMLNNVRHYSTNTKNISIDIVKNRQELFEENYFQISNILKKNGYAGTEKVQEEIELMLFRQEDIFSDLNQLKTRLNFNDDTYNLIERKFKDLCDILNIPDGGKISTRIASAKYIPLIKIIIKELGRQKVGSILLSYFLYILTNETTTVKVGLDNTAETPGVPSVTAYDHMGKEIFNRYLYSLYIKSDIYKKYNASLKEFKDKHKSDSNNGYIYEEGNFHAYLGGEFVQYLLDIGLLTRKIDNDPSENVKHVEYIRIKDDIRKIFLKNNFKIFRLPQRLPMICEPKPYKYIPEKEQVESGGYLINRKYIADELIKEKIGYEFVSKIKEDNIIIDTVNAVIKTPFKINVDTLHYVYKHGISKGIIIDDSKVDIKSFINSPYKRLNKKDKNKYRSIVSKIIMERNILSIAEVYSKVNKIYFPIRLDFRGRMYCTTEYLDYQKSDLAKGLISFYYPGAIKKSDVEIIKYFKGFGANMYGHGLDKKSLNYRVKWVDDNSERLLDFEHNNIVDEAENKTCFISFCFEYKRFIIFLNNINSIIFYTYLPIQLDATCNGYQHLALLSKEIKMLSKLNLDKSSLEDDPNDFYRFVLTMTNDYIKSEINRLENKEDINVDNNLYLNSKDYLNSLKLLKQLDLGRSVLKYVIMKESYSAGVRRLVRDILSDSDFEMIFDEDTKQVFYIYKNSIKVSYRTIKTYVLSLKYILKLIAPKIDKLIKYLNGIVGICSKLRMAIPWVTISGLEITQSYLVEKEHKIPAFTFTKSKYTFKTYLPKKYDYNHQLRAYRPNLIHTLDASVIALLYKSLQGIDLYTVHDCFAVTANNIPRLINDLKLAYIEIYASNNYLLKNDSFLRSNIYNIYGEKVLSDINAKYITVPDNTNKDDTESNGNKYKTIPFPDVLDVVEFSDNNLEERIKQSVYAVV